VSHHAAPPTALVFIRCLRTTIRSVADLHALGSVRLALDDTDTLSASVYGYTPFGLPAHGASAGAAGAAGDDWLCAS
jgi:hypothetical protein